VPIRLPIWGSKLRRFIREQIGNNDSSLLCAYDTFYSSLVLLRTLIPKIKVPCHDSVRDSQLPRTGPLDRFKIAQPSVVSGVRHAPGLFEGNKTAWFSALLPGMCIARFSAADRIDNRRIRRFASPHQLQSELNLAGSSGSGGNHASRR
jgi:hypothetical protein